MKLGTKSEMHFVDYKNDTHFEKYFKTLNFVINQDIDINLMIVNKNDARYIANKMGISLFKLRELFYVKIPERLFYGMTRKLEKGDQVLITIDENKEYESLSIEDKIKEQMNAHSAYRNKGYSVVDVIQKSSNENFAVQIIDVLMGIIIYLIENQNIKKEEIKNNVTQMIKSDLIYRFLIHEDNLKLLHNKVKIFEWDKEIEKVTEINISDYTGNFILHKTQMDIEEMNKLSSLLLKYPEQTTKFYRQKMGYKNTQLKTLLGYIDEINGNGRNSFFYNN